MAENTLAILQYLSSDASHLPSLTSGYAPPATVFLTQFDRFFQYQFTTARLIYGTLVFTLSLILVRYAYQMRAGHRLWDRWPNSGRAHVRYFSPLAGH
jgi:hypothetical protein